MGIENSGVSGREASWIRRNLERILSKAIANPMLVSAVAEAVDSSIDSFSWERLRNDLLNPSVRVMAAFELFYHAIGKHLWPDTTLAVLVDDAGDAELALPMTPIILPEGEGKAIWPVIIMPSYRATSVIRQLAFDSGEIVGDALDEPALLKEWARKYVMTAMVNVDMEAGND